MMKRVLQHGAAYGILILSVSLIVGAGSLVAKYKQPPAGHYQQVEIVVQPGDTLWSIAQAVNPYDDPRAVVWNMRQLNGLLDRTTLYPGQTLLVYTAAAASGPPAQ